MFGCRRMQLIDLCFENVSGNFIIQTAYTVRMPDKQSIAFVLPAFASQNEPNWLPWLQQLMLAIQQKQQNIDITIVSLYFPAKNISYQWNNIEVIALNGYNRKGIKKIIFFLKVFRALMLLKKRKKIKAIVAGWIAEGCFVASWFAYFNRIKFYGWILGQDAKPGGLYQRISKIKSHQLLSLSDAAKELFYKSYGKMPAVLLPGVAEVKNMIPFNERLIDIMGAGSLIPLKQYNILIEVIAALKNTIPNIQCVISGGGEDEQKLKKQIADLNLNDNIDLKGELPHAASLQLMQQAKLFIHPSSYEGFGLVNIEALAAGAKVISFVKPMNEEIENWFIVKTKQEMIDKAKEILLNENAVSKPVIPFSINNTAKQLLQLLLSN